MVIEKRRFARLSLVEKKIQATLVTLSGKITSGCLVPIKDLSKGGAGLFVKQKLEKGAKVVVSVSLDADDHPKEIQELFTGNAPKILPMSGKVVWVAANKDEPKEYPYRVGIEFTPKDDEERDCSLKLYFHFFEKTGGK